MLYSEPNLKIIELSQVDILTESTNWDENETIEVPDGKLEWWT